MFRVYDELGKRIRKCMRKRLEDRARDRWDEKDEE